MKIWLLFLALACLTACQKDRNEPVNAVLAGECRYVGPFSHLADYRYFVCPGFDYNTAPTLNINALGGLSGKSVINQYSG
ncbi:MAG: hypothetical protein LH606_22410, partial [Cytophagaceae bacterium]|nr:hypothetical protein [Cytophagaceae bacterium]